jgi:hypothetical protein
MYTKTTPPHPEEAESATPHPEQRESAGEGWHAAQQHLGITPMRQTFL